MVSDADHEGGDICVRSGGILEISVPCPQFCGKTYTALKQIIFKK